MNKQFNNRIRRLLSTDWREWYKGHKQQATNNAHSNSSSLCRVEHYEASAIYANITLAVSVFCFHAATSTLSWVDRGWPRWSSLSEWICTRNHPAKPDGRPGAGPIHTPHAVADLNQSETRNVAICSADFCLTRWYHKQGSAHTDSVRFCRFESP